MPQLPRTGRAGHFGAHAVIGVRYDTGPMVGAAEVLCYGTAVVVAPVSAP
ncbi:MAG: heavy metal-binding domain-containing protein [Gammaproteobacteria bacterium]|nr:heavy metal-binding domain-containing protein [Gammaproteobacteria bacterium]